MAVLAAIFVTHWLEPETSKLFSAPVITLLVVADIALVSRICYLAGPESSFWLFFYLPILTTSEFLRLRQIFLALFLVIVGLALVLIQYHGAKSTWDLVAIGIMRGGFLVAITIVSAVRTRLDRSRNRQLSARNGQMNSLLNFQRNVAQDFGIPEILSLTDSALREYKGVSAISFWPDSGLNFEWHSRAGLNESQAQALASAAEELRHDGTNVEPKLDSADFVAVPLRTFNRFRGLLFAFSGSRMRLPPELKPYLLSMAEIAASAIIRSTTSSVVTESSQATLSAPAGDAQITWLLDHLTRDKKMDFASVSAVDPYNKTISMIRAVNVQPGWMQRTKFPLDHLDILPAIVRSKQAELLVGNDSRFDQETYKLYSHESIARIFAPMFYGDEVVGVLETGCSIERLEHVRQIFEGVKELARRFGPPVASIRFSDALASVAKGVMVMVGADSATIHLYKGNDITHQASAGLAFDHDFVHLFPPRQPQGIGWHARKDRKEKVIEDPEEVKRRYPHLYNVGIRSLAAYPLAMTEGHEGILYLHFLHPHADNKAEAKLVESVLGVTEGAILSRQLLDEIADSAKWGWMVASQQPVIQSLVGDRDLRYVLEDLVKNMRLMLGADSVVLYPYIQLVGSFEEPVQHGVRTWSAARPDSDSVMWRAFEQCRESPFFGDPRDIGWTTKGSFVDREGIRSCAVVVLQPDRTSHATGVIFVNYRETQTFPFDRRQAITALAASAAITIGTARLRTANQVVWQRELEALRDIDDLITRGLEDPNPEEVLGRILSHSVKLTGAEDGAIHIVEGVNLRVLCREGFAGLSLPDQKLGDGIVGQAAKGWTVVVQNVLEETNYACSKSTTRSEIAVPLKDQNDVLAVINLEHPEKGYFNDYHKDSLETLALQGVIALRSVEAYHKFQRALRAMRAVANRIQRQDEDLETALRLYSPELQPSRVSASPGE